MQNSDFNNVWDTFGKVTQFRKIAINWYAFMPLMNTFLNHP